MSGTVTPTDPKAIHASPTSVPDIQNVPKSIHSAPKSVQLVTHHKLASKADWKAGLGYKGEVILGYWDSKRYLYKIQLNGKEYIETWKKELPDGMEYDCYKGVSSDEYIFLQNNKDIYHQGDDDEKTVWCDKSLTKRTILNIRGVLIDSTGDEVFFARGPLYRKGCRIIVHKTVMEGKSARGVLASALQKLQLDQHRTLKPPSPHGWRRDLSLCRTQLGYVVVESYTLSMDIFDDNGRKYYELKLYFITEISVRK